MHLNAFELIVDQLENILDTVRISERSQGSVEQEDSVQGLEKEITEGETRAHREAEDIPKVGQELELYEKKSLSRKTPRKVKVDHVSAPKKPVLPHYREWEKAFRRLKISMTDWRVKELDVEQTVDRIAQTDIYRLIFRQQIKVTYSLTLLIDRHHSMDLFQPLIDEFCDLVEHSGIFSKVHYLYIDGKEKKTRLYHDRALRQKSKSSAVNADSNNLILVLSSCISPAWRSNSVYQHILEWSRHSLCSIVQMLPQNMWLLTTLAQGKRLDWSASVALKKNSDLQSKKAFFYFDKNTDILKIPVISFEHFSFEAWSGVVLGDTNYAIAGMGFDVQMIENYREVTPTQLTSKERLDNFISQASSSAKRLSAYLANNYVSFEIARIIQSEKYQDTAIAYLAEVFLGGIIERVEQDGHIYYDFYPGIRDELKHHITPDEAWQLFNQTSRFVSRNFDSVLKFPAMIQDPNGVSEIDWDDSMSAFAKIGVDILKRRGGVYHAQALELEQELLELEKPVQAIIPTTKRFQMGSTVGQDREKPVHEVIINYDFEISPYPVTVGEFRAFAKESGYKTEAEKGDGAYVWDGKDYDKKKDAYWDNPYFEQTEDNPVVCVSWNDAINYIDWLNKKTGDTYRLPTEAEWEYAARAGTTKRWSFGDDESKLKDHAWYRENSDMRTHPVGDKIKDKKLPNPWGLYDMHGNVWEWCEDDFVDNYDKTPRDGTAYENKKADSKAVRGGSWGDVAVNARSAIRGRIRPGSRIDYIGFRLLRILPS